MYLKASEHKRCRLLARLIHVGLFLLWVTVCRAKDKGERTLPPQTLRLRISGADVLVEGEQRNEKVISRRPGSSSSDEENYRFLESTVGLNLDGSVFHPYFLTLGGTVRYGINRYSSESKTIDEANMGRSEEASGRHDVTQYDLSAVFLKQKPYATSLSSSFSTSVSDYDFYTRSIVDRSLYGVRSGYWAGPVPFRVSYGWSRDEETTSLDDRSTKEDHRLAVKALHTRTDTDRSSLDYAMNKYNSFNDTTVLSDGVRQGLNLFDTQTFRTGGGTRLQSSLSYYEIDDREESIGLLWSESLQKVHDKHLRSDYEYRLSDQSFGSSESRSHFGSAGLTHRLYESLTSAAEIDGQLTQGRAGESSSDVWRLGGGISEGYTKQIPMDGRLTIDVSMNYHRESGDSGNGDTLATIDEPHTLSGNEAVLLGQPDVDPSSITVTDPTGTIRYREGSDYRVIPRGDSVEIQRVFGGRIPQGQTVLVDYRYGAPASPDYATRDRAAGGSVSFFRDLLVIHGRMSEVDYSGAGAESFDDASDWMIGAALNIPPLSVGASHRVHDAAQLSYTARAYFERLAYSRWAGTTFYLDLDQSETDYEGSGEPERVYSYILRCVVRLTSTLSVDGEAGKRVERGDGYDRELQSLRGGLSYGAGKLTLRVTAEVSDSEEKGSEERRMEEIRIRLRRVF